MDTDRLARLARFLSTTPSRRAVNRALVGLTIGPALAPLFAMTEGEAKKRRKKSKKRRSPPPLPPPQSPPPSPPPCTQGYGPYCLSCCDAAKNEVCEYGSVPGGRCLAGGCPAVGTCTDATIYFCVNFRSQTDLGCVCTTGVDRPESACVEVSSFKCENSCTSSSQCGPGGVCVAYGDYCFCDPPVAGLCATPCVG